jgi:hypothetical protein
MILSRHTVSRAVLTNLFCQMMAVGWSRNRVLGKVKRCLRGPEVLSAKLDLEALVPVERYSRRGKT